MFASSAPVFVFKSFGSRVGGGIFAVSSGLVVLRVLFTSLIYLDVKGSSDSPGASGLFWLPNLTVSDFWMEEQAESDFAGFSVPLYSG